MKGIVYRDEVPTRARIQLLQWMLVWALAVAVVGMHHLATSEQSTHPMAGVSIAAHVDCCDHADAAVSDQHAPMPGGRHDMLHLCLAVLCAALGIGLILIAARRGAVGELFRSLLMRVTHPRSPPPRPRGGPALLASLCVLRL